MPPPRPSGYVPFPSTVLGRFSAACFPHYGWVLGGTCDSEEEVEAEPYEWPAECTPPPPGQPVDEEVVYGAARRDLALKDRYRAELYAFFDDVERSDPPSMAGGKRVPRVPCVRSPASWTPVADQEPHMQKD